MGYYITLKDFLDYQRNHQLKERFNLGVGDRLLLSRITREIFPDLPMTISDWKEINLVFEAVMSIRYYYMKEYHSNEESD